MSDLGDWLRDPEEIYRRSFATIRAETSLVGLSPALAEVAVRIVHACGMTEVAADLAFAGGPAEAARDALKAGAPIFTDSRMTADGIIPSRLPAENAVICTLDEAKAHGTTRSAAAVDLWRARLGGAVVAIGNAPTALFRLLELLAEGAPRPAAILGFPVGFVGAVESKEALIQHVEIPYLTLPGRRGGSAMAAAAVNAIAGLP
ncbi:MAG: precorrin-8X methylmutase [Alphaproteobacteria bacterium]|nr:precorrin-8X methylmutase [Alphaproteobacteria bacterium]